MPVFYQKTTIPIPKIDYVSLWPNTPDDPSDTWPRYKTYSKEKSKIFDLWDADISDRLRQIMLYPTLVRVFRWAPGINSNWHIDGSPDSITQFAINWIITGQGLIQWNSKLDLSNNPRPNAFGYKISTDLDQIEEEASGHGCIVNTAVPHRVINKFFEHRVSVSILFDKDPNLTFDGAIKKLDSVGFLQ